MSATLQRHRTSKVASSYLRLIEQHPLRSIRSDRALASAQRMIDALLKRPLDAGEEEYLDSLSDLVAQYEADRFEISNTSDADLLRFLMENKEVTQQEVSARTGIAKSTLSEILSGKRAISKRHIPKLAAYFHVGPGVFVRRTEERPE